MPVRELLATHTSRDLAEWQAYERYAGPIDDAWRDARTAEIHGLLQSLLHVMTQFAGGSSDGKPHEVTMPHQVYEEYKRRRDRGELD